MDNILKLIKEEDVKWVKLGEVSQFINGYAFKANLFREKGSPIIRITNIQNGAINFNDCKYINLNDYKNLENFLIKKGDILIAMSGATVGKIGYNFKEKEAYLNQRVGKIVPNENILNNKYLYYYLRFKEKTIANLTNSTGAQPNLNKSDIEKLTIPIPSLELQEKIVDILDRYTKSYEELKECLAKEKDLRIKQYEYYRDKLLSEEYLIKKTKELCGEDAKVEVKTFEEIGKFTRGNGLQKKDFSDQGYPVIHYGQIYTKYGFSTSETISYTNELLFSKLRKANKGDILIATTSENLKDVGKSVVWLGEKEIGYSGDMYMYRTSENPKFIAYYFQTVNYQKQKERKVSGTKLIRIHGDDMGKFTIPIPPLKVQAHIVEILDKFNKLTNDIKEGLPKEIELRTKQYEYYRELLFNFKKTCQEIF